MGADRRPRLGKSIILHFSRNMAFRGCGRYLWHSYMRLGDLMGVVHGDDFVFVGLDIDLDFVLKLQGSPYEIKNRGRLGRGSKNVQTIDMLGRTIKITKEGISARC